MVYFTLRLLSVKQGNEKRKTDSYIVFRARALPVVRKVKFTNVQRNAKTQNEQALILIGVTRRFLVRLIFDG
jgi:hypothetical protein